MVKAFHGQCNCRSEDFLNPQRAWTVLLIVSAHGHGDPDDSCAIWTQTGDVQLAVIHPELTHAMRRGTVGVLSYLLSGVVLGDQFVKTSPASAVIGSLSG